MKTWMTAAILSLACALGAYGTTSEAGKIYYGSRNGTGRVAEISAKTVFNAIPEYKRIKEKGLTAEDSGYWLLLGKANEKFYKAVRKAARDSEMDGVIEKGSVAPDEKAMDLTLDVIRALDDTRLGV